MRRPAVALAVGALLLAACAGDEPVTAPSTTREAPTTTTSSTTPEPAIDTLAATDPDDLARQLAQVELLIRDPQTSPATRAAAGRLQQRVYRRLAERPELREPTLALLDRLVLVVAEPNVVAASELLLLTKPRSALPDWRIVPPASADELKAHYRAAEAQTGVGWTYLAAIHLVETRMGRIRGTSTAGAQGPMQFLPSTWKQYGNGGDIEDNGDAIAAAARMLKANGAPERMRDALYSYNHSDRYVTAIEAYARTMAEDELTFLAYHHWQVFYRLSSGTVVLPEGYPEARPEPL